jgi:transposase
LPPSPRDWLGEDHLVHFVMDVVATLDISEIDRKYQEKDHRGERPYDPRMLLALLVYGYCIGVRSSRRLERATWEDVAVRYLASDNHPDHSVIADFRRAHLDAFRRLLQVPQLCMRAGMVKLGRVALDGTKVKASASKHEAMSYQRMKEREKELEAEVARMLAEAEAADSEEDAVHGKGHRGDEHPKELRRRQDRLAQYLRGPCRARSRRRRAKPSSPSARLRRRTRRTTRPRPSSRPTRSSTTPRASRNPRPAGQTPPPAKR